jgi:seryl-tRNA synthetase
MKDLSDILTRWDHTRTGIKKMPFEEAAKDMECLVAEIRTLQTKLAYQEKQIECKKQEYETMHLEIGNVLHKYL